MSQNWDDWYRRKAEYEKRKRRKPWETEAEQDKRESRTALWLGIGIGIPVLIIFIAIVGAAISTLLPPEPVPLTSAQKVVEKDLLENVDVKNDKAYTYELEVEDRDSRPDDSPLDESVVAEKYGYKCRYGSDDYRRGNGREDYIIVECVKQK